jgi:hypothetical protein
MAKAYIDGLSPDEEYKRQKRLLEMEFESLVVPVSFLRLIDHPFSG